MASEAAESGIPTERIVIGGFSQGGAVSLFSGLTAKVKLGGVVGLSSYLPINKKFTELIKDDANNVNKNTPVFMGHGEADPMVRFELGKMSSDMLTELGFDVTLKSYK